MAQITTKLAEPEANDTDSAGELSIPPRYAMPVATVLVGLIGGILVDRYWMPPLWVYTVVVAVGLALGLASASATARFRVPDRMRSYGLPLSVGLVAFAVGGMRHADDYRRIPPHHILNFTDDSLVAARVRGIVRTAPAVSPPPMHPFSKWLPRSPGSSLLISSTDIRLTAGWSACCGRVRVNAKEPLAALKPGDRVEIYGRLSRLQPPSNPGQYDWRDYYWRSGIFAGLSVDHAEAVQSCADQAASLFTRFQNGLRSWASRLLIEDQSDDETGGLLSTLVLGFRHAVDPRLNDAFIRTGTVHFLSVSGLHVGMIAAIILFFTRLLNLSRRKAAAVSAPLIASYLAIAEPWPPILRAGIMALLLTITTLTLRPSRNSLWLPMAAVVLLIARPAWLFDVSMQLSFIVIGGVVYLTPAVVHLFRSIRNRILRRPPEGSPLALIFRDRDRREEQTGLPLYRILLTWLGWAIAVSVAAWLACVPIAAYHFGQVSPLGWFSSLILSPVVFLVLFSSCAKIVFALFLPTLATYVTPVVTALTSLLTSAVSFLAAWPGMYFQIRPPPWILVAGCYLLLAAWAWRVPLLRSVRRRSGLAVVVLVGGIWFYWPANAARSDLVITCLAVGNGSATLIQLPDGRNLIYDAGTLRNFDVGRSVIVPAARTLGIKRFDAALISHPNLDHFSGLPSTHEAIGIGRVYVSRHFKALSDAGAAREFLDYLKLNNIRCLELSPGQPLDMRPVDFRMLWPPDDPASPLDVNESSLVVKLSYAGRSVLFCGDIEQKAQEALLQHPDLRADVLILPHHGAFVRNTADFVRAVGPVSLIRSTDQRDSYSGRSLLDLAREYGWYSTAERGAVTVRITPTNLDIVPFH